MPPKGHKITWGNDLTGYVTHAVNVGTGDGQVYRDEVPPGQLNLKTIKDGTSINVVNNADDITINNTAPENTTVANVGAGAGLVYRDKTIDQINLKTVKAGAGITVTNNADDIEISAPGAHNTKTETEVLLLAADSAPCITAPWAAAPLRDIDLVTNSMSIKGIEYAPLGGGDQARGWTVSTRWIAKPGTAFYTVNAQVNAFCDNASLNNISFVLGHYSQSYPGGDYTTALTDLAAIVNPGIGAYKMLRFNFQFDVAGDVLLIRLARTGIGDTNPGYVYVPHILLYFNQALS